jgi:hypothetical protein
MAYVYSHTRLDNNEVFYIGVSLASNGHKRAFTRFSRSKGWNKVVSITEYKVDIIIDNISPDDAKMKEIEYISLYKETLVNKHKGGNANLIKDEVKNKIRNSSIGKVMSKTARVKMSESKKGKTISEETKTKMSNSKLGNTISELNKKITSDRMSKLVLDLETGIFYDRITDAAESKCLKRPWLSMMLNGKYNNNTSLVLV